MKLEELKTIDQLDTFLSSTQAVAFSVTITADLSKRTDFDAPVKFEVAC